LLPGALNDRTRIFHENEHIDIAVSNGYIHANGIDTPVVTPALAKKIRQDIAVSFFDKNWFASAAPAFRAASIGPDLFNFNLKYFELSYLFLQLISREKKFFYSDNYLYRIHSDTPSSASKSVDYIAAFQSVLLDMKKLPCPERIKKLIHKKYIGALHAQSDAERVRGNLKEAWMLHMKCLFSGGWTFLTYTRHLLCGTTAPCHGPDAPEKSSPSNRT
jgi:hypothetical protein